MSEPIRPCPHCQGSDLKIQDRLLWDGGGNVLTCQNSECIARIWGEDEADVIARWNRRAAGPALKSVLDLIDICLDVAGVAEVRIDEETARALLAEWK